MLFGGQTGAILFAFLYRAKKLAKQQPTGFEYWGCANRIVNGRAVCDSHHVNEDVLYATYHAAVEAMIEDAGALLEVIQTETEVEMQPLNKAAMDEVEQ